MAHAWLRAGRRFLAVQTALVDQAGAQLGEGAGVDAVVAAADAPVIFAQKFPDSGALLLSVRRQDVLAGDVPDETASELRELDKLLVNLMVCLAIEMWDRKDAAAVEVITACIVDLPTALLLRRGRLGSASARAQLHAAVRAVLAVGPTPPRRRRADPPLTPPQKGKLRDA